FKTFSREARHAEREIHPWFDRNCGIAAARPCKSLQRPTFFGRGATLGLSLSLSDSRQWNSLIRCDEARTPSKRVPDLSHGTRLWRACFGVERRRQSNEPGGQDALDASRHSHPFCAGRALARFPVLRFWRPRPVSHRASEPRQPADLAARMALAGRSR